MKYVKIREMNYNEALLHLKREYGDDAIPISHKWVKEGGLFNTGFFAKDMVELTAAVQDKRPSGRRPGEERSNIDLTVGGGKSDSLLSAIKSVNLNEHKKPGNTESIMKTIEEYNRNPEGFKGREPQEADERLEPEEARSVQAVSCQERSDTTFNSFENQIRDIRDTLNRISSERRGGSDPVIEKTEEESQPQFSHFIEILKNNDYDSEECGKIMKEFKNGVSRDDLKDKYKIEKNFKELLMNRIVTTGPLKFGNRKKVLMFIGPTGVGKTTTMAKLGALFSLREGRSVTFITLDNYRIAATEQLKKYAEIMRIPVYAINDQNEFRDTIAGEKSDIIMVDTSGRSHRNDSKIADIKSFADVVDCEFEKFLCVSANTKKRDVNEIFRAFEPVNYNSVIITKVDETSFLGNIVDVADKYNKPISYFTHGQEVPNDIVVAESGNIAEMMLGNINYV